METDNGANCEVLSPVMEDERVSTVASTAPDQTLMLSASRHRIPAPKYRPPPSYHQIRSHSSNTSANPAELGHSDHDYADCDSRDEDNDYHSRRSPQQMYVSSQDFNDQIFFADEYQPRRQLQSNGTIKSTTTNPSIHHHNSLHRMNPHNNSHKRNHCRRFHIL